jgi:hypothetical protein
VNIKTEKKRVNRKIGYHHWLMSKILFISILFLPCLASCTSTSTNPSKGIDYMNPYIVQINLAATGLDDGRAFANIPIGTGFMVNRDGYVITANHVIGLGQYYMQKIPAASKKLGVIIPPPPEVLGCGPQPEPMPVNDFDIIARDEDHDLALLKLKLTYITPPSSGGKVLPFAQFSNGCNGTLPYTPISINADSPKEGEAIGISGYPLEQIVLITNTGHVASRTLNLKNVMFSRAPEGFPSQNIADCYFADVNINYGDSGGPVYLISNNSIIGVYLSITNQSDGSRMTVVVPARHVVDLLESNGVNWIKVKK